MSKIEINGEVLDGLVIAGLRESAHTICKLLIDEDFGKEIHGKVYWQDVTDSLLDLAAINRIIKYYGGQPVELPAIADSDEGSRK